MTPAPCACNSDAVALPIPVEAPTSQTVLPCQFVMGEFKDMEKPPNEVSAFGERQRDIAKMYAELAHLRLVQHDPVADQVHPVVKSHLVDGSIHG